MEEVGNVETEVLPVDSRDGVVEPSAFFEEELCETEEEKQKSDSLEGEAVVFNGLLEGGED